MTVNELDFDAVIAQLSALSFLIWHESQEEEPVPGYFWGLGQVIHHIEKDLKAIKEEAEKGET